MNDKEKKIKSHLIYEGKILSLYVDDVVLPDGNISQREIVRHHGGACVLAIINDKIIMEKQFRYAYNDFVYELPAGKVEKGEDPKATARRELLEETGYEAEELISLGEVYPSVGYTDEIIYLYIAKGLTKKERHLDPNEYLDVIYVDKDEALKMIKDGRIKDSKSQIAILKYFYL